MAKVDLEDKLESKVHIIAEAGTNHNGKLTTAKELVQVAVKSGVNSVKFQLIYPEGLYLPMLYQDGQFVDNEVYQKRMAAMLTDDDYRQLAAYCKEQGIGFSASIFDKRGIDLLDELGADYYKIASCDLNNSRLIVEAAERGKRIVISTGMASLGEIERAVLDVVSSGNSDIVLMHCVSIYPCSLELMNLSFLNVLKAAFGFPIGLSDHTESSLASAMAVSMGAEWIEKHFTLDRMAEGFDHSYAMEPSGFMNFVRDVREAEAASIRQQAKVQSEESMVKNRARRALYAARDIQPGETLSIDDVLIVRPEGPLAPNDLPLTIGRKAKCILHRFEPLSLDKLEDDCER